MITMEVLPSQGSPIFSFPGIVISIWHLTEFLLQSHLTDDGSKATSDANNLVLIYGNNGEPSCFMPLLASQLAHFTAAQFGSLFIT